MEPAFVDLLRCPRCRGILNLKEPEMRNQSVDSGRLTCAGCRSSYPIIRGIPRFVSSDEYLRNFTLEWTVHSRTPYDENLGAPLNEYMFDTRIGFKPEMVSGNLVLDAGCGSGRYLKLMRKWNARVVGLDYSYAIDSCAKNLWPDSNVHLVQGDMLNPPFAEEIFDAVFSSGAIHHTPDPPRAFSSLVRLVKRGGRISVWVYPDEGFLGMIPNRVAYFYRAVARRVPPASLYRICRAVQGRIQLPRVLYEDFFDITKSFAKGFLSPRQAIYILAPFWSLAPFKEWRIMDTFDFLSAKHKFYYSYSQVILWFQEERLVGIEKCSFPVGVRGVKPIAYG